MQFVKLNGIALHYQVIGGPEGKPALVFSNSLGTDFRIWRDIIVRLAGNFTIITYDKRGHGLSDAPSAPYSMDDHINDLSALLDHLEVKKAIVCGLSVGGMIAQGLTFARPDLVQALILCDTAHKIGNDDLWNERIAKVEEGGIEAIAESIMTRWFSEAYRDPDNPDFAGYHNMLVRTPCQGYVGTSYALRDADFTSQTPTISVPTLCVVGNEDGSTPPLLVKELADLIPDALFEVIAGAGHLPCIEKPEALFSVMQPFLQKVIADD